MATLRVRDVPPVRRAAKPERLHRRTVAESREGLERVLEAIHKGELTASAGYVARLEGAIAALEALLGESPDVGEPA